MWLDPHAVGLKNGLTHAAYVDGLFVVSFLKFGLVHSFCHSCFGCVIQLTLSVEICHAGERASEAVVSAVNCAIN